MFIQKIQEARLENIKILRKIIEKGKGVDYTNVIKKINNYINRFSGIFTKEEILSKILQDNLVASIFSKDPIKQNIYEKISLKYLQDNGLKIKKSTKYIVFSEGDLYTGTKFPGLKDCDFIEDNYVYYSHKYTKGIGGAQDNQFNDLLSFVKEARKYCIKHKDKKLFVVLVDGAYYTKDKICILSSYNISNRLYVGSTTDYIDYRNNE